MQILHKYTFYLSEEWVRVDALIEAAGNPSRTERFSKEDLVRVKKYMKISPSYVYTRKISAKEPFTEEIRNAMTESVKQSAFKPCWLKITKDVLGKSVISPMMMKQFTTLPEKKCTKMLQFEGLQD